MIRRALGSVLEEVRRQDGQKEKRSHNTTAAEVSADAMGSPGAGVPLRVALK